jgi:hypothetical protein
MMLLSNPGGDEPTARQPAKDDRVLDLGTSLVT